MSLWKCSHCGRRFDDDSAARQGWHAGDRDEPSYWFDACLVCQPSDEDRDRARDAAADHALSEMREGDGPDGFR